MKHVILLTFFVFQIWISNAQNQIKLNLFSTVFGIVELDYERTLKNDLVSFGLCTGVSYRSQNELNNRYSITPYARLNYKLENPIWFRQSSPNISNFIEVHTRMARPVKENFNNSSIEGINYYGIGLGMGSEVEINEKLCLEYCFRGGRKIKSTSSMPLYFSFVLAIAYNF